MKEVMADITLILSAVGGCIGFITMGYTFARSRNGYVRKVSCDVAVKKFEDAVSRLHEKINTVSLRVAKLEGILSVKEDKNEGN